jgi:hypothetical protein
MAPPWRFWSSSWRRRMARAGSRGKYETSARAFAPGEIRRLYKLPFPPSSPFLLHQNPMRDRWCVEVWCPARWRSFPVGFVSVPKARVWSDAALHRHPSWDFGRWSSSSFIFVGSVGARGGGVYRIYFVSVSICFLFVSSPSSSPLFISCLLRRPPQGEIHPQCTFFFI